MSNMKTAYYQVGGHVFGVSGEEELFALMENYEPFLCDKVATDGKDNDKVVTDGENDDGADMPSTLFSLAIGSGEAPAYSEELRQDEEGQEIVCGRTADGEAVFEFHWWQETAGWLVCSPDYHQGRLLMTGRYTKMAIDNALMVLYALATADRGTVLFHAAVVSRGGRGYMFLGKSGTGKSTHARLWLKYIEGSALVNDDNPVVRLADDGYPIVYGSPWSGKTPCYRNVSYPLGGIVMLSQAPYNKIQRLGGIQAYASLVASISGKRWDSRVADGLHETENALASTVAVWHLECLPDEAAAKVCCAQISNEFATPHSDQGQRN